MSKEEDISFSTVLQRVLTGQAPTKMLLDHSEFQRRVRQICMGIDRSDRVDQLVQQTCAQVLRRISTLKADLQDEDQFFRWLFVVAKNLHRGAELNKCNDSSRVRPDTTAGLSSDELDEFYEHAYACRYHAEILTLEEDEEEENFRSMVQVARGLHPHGVISTPEDLDLLKSDHEQRLKAWNEAAFDSDLAFEFIGLYNDGKEKATASEFDRVHICKTDHELNPHAGLQIRGMTARCPDKYVLLGFYRLTGVRHDQTEKLLHLANGFTVGLSITQHTDTKFTLGFRCVKTEVIEQEKARASLNPQATDEILQDEIRDGDQSLAGTTTIPAFIAAALSRCVSYSGRVFKVVGLVFLLLIPAYVTEEPNEGTRPITRSGSYVNGAPHKEESEGPPGAGREQVVTSLNDVSPDTRGAIKELQKPARINRTPARPLAHTGRVYEDNDNRVETIPIWQVRVYQPRPSLAPVLLVTHFVDNQIVKEKLEQFLPDSSFELVVLSAAHKPARPKTGYKVVWKTQYLHENIVSVEASVDRLDSKARTSSFVREACSTVGCNDRQVIANAIGNVYGTINPDWKSRILFTMNNLRRCLFGSIAPSSILPNGFGNAGVFDEIPDCEEVAGGSPSTQ